MRGEVEIWDGDKLLHKESNLLVNGAGELLADIMTVSPSLSGIADHATSSILDSSNYTIQAISFGKDASAYQYNAHAMNSRRNLITFSTPSATDIADDNWYANYATVSSVPEITPPPKYADIPSSTAHVVAIIEEDDDANGYLSYTQTNQYDWTLSGGQDNWICASVYVKYPIDEAAVLPVPDGTTPDLTIRHPRIHFSYNLRGEGWNGSYGYGQLGYSRLGTTVEYATDTTPNYTTPSSMVLQYNLVGEDTNEYRSSAYGYSIENWRQNGGASYEGDGWYRVWTAGLAPVSGLSAISFYMYPTSFMSDPVGITEGGMYTYGWQLELGRWPTELQFNNQNYQFNNWDVSGSVLNRDHSPGAVEDNGTVRVLNEPIPNPNLLFYTDDPWNSPGLGAGDLDGIYWYGINTPIGGFSGITETDPFGGASSIALSGSTGAGAYTYLAAKEVSAIEAGGGSTGDRGIYLKHGYNTIFSTYVKRPDSGALTPSSFVMMVHDIQEPDDQTNSVTFVYLTAAGAGSGIPTIGGQNSGSTGFIEDVGNDWYRISNCVSGLGRAEAAGNDNTVEGDMCHVRFYLGDYYDQESSDESLWLFAPQVEQWPIGYRTQRPGTTNETLGTPPTKYRAVSGNVPTYAEDNLLTSSYTPINYLSSPPNPESTRVEDGDTALFDTSCSVVSGFNMGQNLNVIPYREQGDQEPKFFNCLTNNVTNGQDQYDWIAAYGNYTAAQLSGIGSLGPQGYYLGCYPEGSSTGGSNWALVSSLDNSAAYLHVDNGTDPNFVSGTYNSIVNEASSMDASGFVGKVYDPKQVVGNVPNPNMFAYTVYWTDDPDVDPDDGDFNGTWTCNANMMGGWSAVDVTNPFGGPSSMVVSAGIDPESGGSDVVYALALAQNPENDYTVTPNFLVSAGNSYYQSMYVKRGGTLAEGYTSSMIIKIKDVDATGPPDTTVGYQHTIEYADDGVVPTVKNADANSILTIEDVGNDWYRFINRVDGNNLHSDTAIGDRLTCYWYLGDTAGTGGSRENITDETNGKKLYMWAPQAEVHPTSYGISSTPYQAVSGLSPTVAEQQGEGGLHVSGGIDATNSGTVEYSMIVGSGDVGYSNLYGGIYNMGLWTIDMDESIKAGNTPPYSFGPLNNPRKYKLFATKHLTKNLGYIEDSGTNAGSLNYSDLTIKWRLHFH